MKERLLFGTIGLLIGIVVMQWTMPSGEATVATQPTGVVVAAASDAVLATDGGIWFFHLPSNGWVKLADLPVPISEVQFLTAADAPEFDIVDKSGNQWEFSGGAWVNHGHPPVSPVATEQSTWGKVKAEFSGKGDKQ